MEKIGNLDNATNASKVRKEIVGKITAILPGLVLAALLAVLALAGKTVFPSLPLSPLIVAVVLGALTRNFIGPFARAKIGIAFSLRRMLRLGIVLLGLQLTFAQVLGIGWVGMSIIILTIASTFFLTIGAGRLFGVDPKLSELLAAGTSICGASAILATNAVTQGRDEDVVYAAACVTVLGSVAMVLYPLLPQLLDLSPLAYGLWAGASIHEVAQVVAAGYQSGQVSGDAGTVTKLARVMMLAPMVVGLGMVITRRHPDAGSRRVAPPFPFFVLGFLAMIGVASSGALPQSLIGHSVIATQFFLAIGMAAIGLETDFSKLAAKGLRPLMLAVTSWLFIALFSLAWKSVV